MEDEEVEAMLKEAHIPEFAWDQTLHTIDHEGMATMLDSKSYRGGCLIIIAGVTTMNEYDSLWYGAAKHLVLQEEEIEFVSLQDIINIAQGESSDTDADHIFIEGFCYAERNMPLNPRDEHSVKEQIRYWLMNGLSVYPYMRGANTASIQAWWGEDFTNYLCSLLNEYWQAGT